MTPAFVRGLPGHPGGLADLPPRRAGVAGGFNGCVETALVFEHPCYHVLDGCAHDGRPGLGYGVQVDDAVRAHVPCDARNGEEESGLLVTLVRKNAVELAERHGRDLVIIDGPPGIGCPVIAAITGVDLVLVVAEPSLSSLHDLRRVLGVVEHFGIPAAVCVNKADINPGNVRAIAALCGSRGARVVGLLPYDGAATAAMIAGKTLIPRVAAWTSSGGCGPSCRPCSQEVDPDGCGVAAARRHRDEPDRAASS